MAEHPAVTLKEDRPIATDEARIVIRMLEHASVTGSLDRLLPSIPSLRVVRRCSSGCPSVDFVVNGQMTPSQPIADGTGRDTEGREVGVVVWGTTDAVTGLEFYEMSGPVTHLPSVGSLSGW